MKFALITCCMVLHGYASTLPDFQSKTIELNYTELHQFNISCFPSDSCSAKDKDDLSKLRKCDCDSLCSEFNTCCIDSPYLQASPPLGNETSSISCHSVPGSSAYYLISKCDSRWNGNSIIKDMCEDDSEVIRDPVASAPVTCTKSQSTYKNYFCAICNDNFREVVFWNIIIDIDENPEDYKNKTQEEMLKELVFDKDTENWKVLLLDFENKLRLVSASIKYSIPENLTSLVRECSPSVISSCPDTWEDNVTKKKCDAYMAIVYFNNFTVTAYRNIHCAICNGMVNLKEIQCSSNETKSRGKQFSFPFLLDVNMKSGNKVGKIMCPEDEMYDPFFKKCRALKCVAPNATISNGKCKS